MNGGAGLFGVSNDGELGLDDMSYIEPTDSAWQETWRTTEAIILTMNDEVRQEGAGFMVVTLTAGDQIHPDSTERRHFADTLGVEDLLYADRRIAKLGTNGGFPVLNLAPPFQEYAEAHNIHLHGFHNPGSGHWNEVGHRLAAELLAEDVCENWDWLIR